MPIKPLLAGPLLALLLAGTAHAQGTLRGAQEGAEAGGAAAGPVGAVVGGALGAASGTVGGVVGVADRPHRPYRRRAVRSQDYDGAVAVGAQLPPGVTYYDVPNAYPVARGSRYTVVNDRPVIVDARGRIVEVLN